MPILEETAEFLNQVAQVDEAERAETRAEQSAVDLTNDLFSSRKTTMENAQTWNRGNLEGITKWNEGQSLSL